ncbi:uncharacterized protein LOC133340554 [Lethenteron reissneri]|uniref:uncharacterized protein LOC133340554 n=1 Tax=Lethenteron reissneri TaxID=7753 RepID=UPI002AB763DC|nr:uncharacterized protein LOC133340554 [Lethenteron reissneri]XP_061404840.1 uncharacterized protein LOC133340554 [Lethenteron reissneri]
MGLRLAPLLLLLLLPSPGTIFVRGQSQPSTGVFNCTAVDTSSLSALITGGRPSVSTLRAFSAREFACLSDSVLAQVSSDTLGKVVASVGLLREPPALRELVSRLKPQEPSYSLGPLSDFLESFNNEVVHSLLRLGVPESRALLQGAWAVLRVNVTALGDADVARWFNASQLGPLLPGLDADTALSVPLAVSCNKFATIVGAFSRKVYSGLDVDVRRAVVNMSLQFYQPTVPARCSIAVSSEELLRVYLGLFGEQAELAELSRLLPTFQPLEALGYLGAEQLAVLAAQPGFLGNSSLVIKMFELSLLSYESVATFLDKLIATANPSTLSDLNLDSKRLVLTFVWALLEPRFPTLGEAEWGGAWLSRRLPPFLVAIQPHQVASVPASFNCSAFQAFYDSFESLYDRLPVPVRTEVARKITQLLQPTVAERCGKNVTSEDLLLKYYGLFYREANFSDFTQLLPSFKGSAMMTSSTKLTALQLADLLISLGPRGTRADATQALAQFSTLPWPSSDLVAFTERIGQGAGQLSDEVRSELVTGLWGHLTPHLVKMKEVELSTWMGHLLGPLLPALSPSTQLFPAGLTCSSYLIMMAALNNSYDNMSASTQHSIYLQTKQYLKVAKGCPLENVTSGTFLSTYLGKFSRQAAFSEFTEILPTFQPLQVLEQLSPAQLGDLAGVPELLNSTAVVDQILANVHGMAELSSFMERYTNASTSQPSVEVRARMMSQVWGTLGPSLATLPDAQVSVWFSRYLAQLLPTATSAQLASLPPSLNCSAFQAIVGGLDGAYSSLSVDARRASYLWMSRFLSVLPTEAPRCGVPAGTVSGWIPANLGHFVLLASRSDLQGFLTDAQQLDAALTTDAVVDTFRAARDLPSDLQKLVLGAMLNRNFTADKIPDSVICVYPDVTTVPPTDAVLVAKLKACLQSASAGSASAQQQQQKIALAILAGAGQQLSAAQLVQLGPVALLLSPAAIANLSGQAVLTALPTLGQQSGWSLAQAQQFVNKLVDMGVYLGDSMAIGQLGTLVSGLPSSAVLALPDSEARSLLTLSGMQDPAVGSAMPPSVAAAIMEKAVRVSTDPVALVKDTPGWLVWALPLDTIRTLPSSMPLGQINSKEWTETQSMIIFKSMKRGYTWTETGRQFGSLLRGFTCNQLSGQVDARDFATSVNGSEGHMTRSQLKCIAEAVAPGPGTLSETDALLMPSGVLAYVEPDEMRRMPQCREVLRRVGGSSPEIFPPNHSRPKRLLNATLHCLGRSEALRAEDVAVLGWMSCSLSVSQLQGADSSVLEGVSACGHYSSEQVAALPPLLTRRYGYAVGWSGKTVKSLSDLLTVLKMSMLDSMPTDVIREGSQDLLLRDVQEKRLRTQVRLRRGRSVENLGVRLVKRPIKARVRRAACTGTPYTRADLLDLGSGLPWLSLADLVDCIAQATIADSLDTLGAAYFSADKLQALKTALGAPSTNVDAVALRRLALALSPSELQALDLIQLDLVSVLATIPGWSQDQLAAVAEGFLAGRAVSSLTAREISSLGTFLAGIPDLSGINKDAYKLAAESVGNVDTFSPAQLQALFSVAKTVWGSNLTAWTPETINQAGCLLAAASVDEWNTLQSDQVGVIKPVVLLLTPPNTLVALSPAVLSSLRVESVATIADELLQLLNQSQLNSVARVWGDTPVLMATPTPTPTPATNNTTSSNTSNTTSNTISNNTSISSSSNSTSSNTAPSTTTTTIPPGFTNNNTSISSSSNSTSSNTAPSTTTTTTIPSGSGSTNNYTNISSSSNSTSSNTAPSTTTTTIPSGFTNNTSISSSSNSTSSNTAPSTTTTTIPSGSGSTNNYTNISSSSNSTSSNTASSTTTTTTIPSGFTNNNTSISSSSNSTSSNTAPSTTTTTIPSGFGSTNNNTNISSSSNSTSSNTASSTTTTTSGSGNTNNTNNTSSNGSSSSTSSNSPITSSTPTTARTPTTTAAKPKEPGVGYMLIPHVSQSATSTDSGAATRHVGAVTWTCALSLVLARAAWPA